MNFDAIRPIHDEALEARIRTRLDSLAKPQGSLGKLEELALQLGLIQQTDAPRVGKKAMIVFCADHGIVEEGVSPYPSEVTRQMEANFAAGGAAINVLCRHGDIEPVIVDMGIGKPTRNFAREPAMTIGEAELAMDWGFLFASKGDTLGVGEMGIGNTTCAAAMFSAFSGLDPLHTTGRGTGLDDARLVHEIKVIRQALALHQPDPTDAMKILADFGGFEIAAIAGLILGAAEQRRILVLDGFVTCAAALVARAFVPASMDYVVFSQGSAERGHKRMLEFLGARPLLNLEMRLGDGSGAALGIGIVESAVNLYTEMAMFQGAGVSRN